MGTRYLAMAIVNKKQGTPAPFEWGGKKEHAYLSLFSVSTSDK
jgi:hypothetical protein